MSKGDFYEEEKSHVMKEKGYVTITLETSGKNIELKKVDLEKGEVIDASRMKAQALITFFEKELEDS